MSADASLRITSPKNPRVAALRALLDKRAERDAAARFVVEGAREIGRALASDQRPLEAYTCPESLSSESKALLSRPEMRGLAPVELSLAAYAKLAVREGVDGLLVVFALERQSLASLDRLFADRAASSVPLLLAAQNIEKPGNLGALLRTADGAGVDAVVTLDDAVDPFGPQAIRGSVGAVFHVPVVAASSEEFRAWCKRHSVRTFGAALTPAAQPYATADLRGPSAIVLGPEDVGLSADWLGAADALVVIPMAGIGDSLNVSVAGAVLLYEARRQRGL
jgi:TrmH family RNA methyltransferase